MRQFFAMLYDRIMKFEYSTILFKERKSLLAKAHGRVLEIGSGTGINFPLYKGVESVDAIEPNKYMRLNDLNHIKDVPPYLFLFISELQKTYHSLRTHLILSFARLYFAQLRILRVR